MDGGENVVAVESLAEREDEAGEVQAAPIEVIEGEEDLSGDDDDDTVQVKTHGEDDDGEDGGERRRRRGANDRDATRPLARALRARQGAHPGRRQLAGARLPRRRRRSGLLRARQGALPLRRRRQRVRRLRRLVGAAHRSATRTRRSSRPSPRAAADGTSFGAPTEREVEFAEELCRAVPSMEMVRLVSSGTEATMAALRVARGFTGRDKIVKIDGGYHGASDTLLVAAGSGIATLGIPGSAGVTAGTAADTLTVPWNDEAAMRAVFDANAGQIAAVIVEPVCGNMGCVPPRAGLPAGAARAHARARRRPHLRRGHDRLPRRVRRRAGALRRRSPT